MLIYKQ